MEISKGKSISMEMVLGVISNCTIAMYRYCWGVQQFPYRNCACGEEPVGFCIAIGVQVKQLQCQGSYLKCIQSLLKGSISLVLYLSNVQQVYQLLRLCSIAVVISLQVQGNIASQSQCNIAIVLGGNILLKARGAVSRLSPCDQASPLPVPSCSNCVPSG